MAQRCGYCGKTEKQHGGKACIALRGYWTGQQAKPQAKGSTSLPPTTANGN